MTRRTKTPKKQPKRAGAARCRDPIPPALAAVAQDVALDPATTATLARVNIDGAQPTTPEGWALVWLAIRHACAIGRRPVGAR